MLPRPHSQSYVFRDLLQLWGQLVLGKQVGGIIQSNPPVTCFFSPQVKVLQDSLTLLFASSSLSFQLPHFPLSQAELLPLL